ncbi:MAG: hypothetical protein IH945_05545, partial [Armatimonadetes bacterium]|nr:hypothetical protein [Armatimonadota bacterium]
LVVIAIIAILAAILFPVFAQAKLAAKKTAGLAQMKQLAIASIMYATDYDDGIMTWNECLAQLYRDGFYEPGVCDSPGVPPLGRWEPGRFWDTKLSPYVKSGKPQLNDHSGLWTSPGKENNYFGRSIGMNQLTFWNPSSFGIPCSGIVSGSRWSGCYFWLKLGETEDVANTMLMADTGTGGRYEPMYFLNGYAEQWIPTYWQYQKFVWSQPWRYGDDGANYTWLDGHAKYRKGDEIYVNFNHEPTLAWPSSVTAALMCNTLNYQASTTGMIVWLDNYIQNVFGVTCTPLL